MCSKYEHFQVKNTMGALIQRFIPLLVFRQIGNLLYRSPSSLNLPDNKIFLQLINPMEIYKYQICQFQNQLFPQSFLKAYLSFNFACIQKYKYKFMHMKSSKPQIEQEYHHLKNKVEDQIKILEQKLAKNSEIHYHRSISSLKNLQVPSKSEYHLKTQQRSHQRCYCMHQCIHQHSKFDSNCNGCSVNTHNCCPSRNSSFHGDQSSQNNLLNGMSMTVKNSRNQQLVQKSNDLQNQKVIEQNQFLEQIFLKNIENQKELSDNLKFLAQKIQKLQTKPKQSSDRGINYKNTSSKQHDSLRGYMLRARSQAKQQFTPVLREHLRRQNIPSDTSKGSKSRSTNKKKIKSSKSNSKQKNQYQFNVKSEKKFKGPSLHNLKAKKNKDKCYNQNWRVQYFGNEILCPVHSSPKICRIKSRDKQVYQDTYHRNRKHERDHLVESFKQQDIARKKLMEKILKTQGILLKNK